MLANYQTAMATHCSTEIGEHILVTCRSSPSLRDDTLEVKVLLLIRKFSSHCSSPHKSRTYWFHHCAVLGYTHHLRHAESLNSKVNLLLTVECLTASVCCREPMVAWCFASTASWRQYILTNDIFCTWAKSRRWTTEIAILCNLL